MKITNSSHPLHPLGELEAAIMEIVWDLKKASVRDVLDKINKQRKVAYTTVMTVMSRLADKGILSRSLDESGAYQYRPTKCKEDFLAGASKKAINQLIREYGAVAIAQFIDVIESSDKKDVAKWRKELKKIR